MVVQLYQINYVQSAHTIQSLLLRSNIDIDWVKLNRFEIIRPEQMIRTRSVLVVADITQQNATIYTDILPN